jgi:IS5 family transposase
MDGCQATSITTRSPILIITYARDEQFVANPLVRLAMAQPKFQQLHDLLAEVFSDPQVQLAMRHDLAPPKTQASWNGAPALALVPTGCLAVVRRLMGWSYRLLAEQVNLSAGWRWVCQLYAHKMPNFRTLQEREALLSARTVQRIHAKVLTVAQQLGMTLGARLRLDSSVIETDIHYPTDSRLLDDAARVLSRGLRRARQLLVPSTPAEKACLRDRHRQAHRLARQIAQARRKGAKNTAKTAEKLYRQLLGLVEQLLEQLKPVTAQLAGLSGRAAAGVVELFTHYVPLVQQVVAQTRRRVLEGASVPAPEKLVSLFEPHTAIIRRGKAPPRETEFGVKVWYAEVEGGLLSEYRLLKGNPPDEAQVVPSMPAHRRVFGRAPREVSGDRGLHSAENERQLRQLGVRHVCLPQPGYKSAKRKRRERQDWYRAALRFRNGIEGRISHLRRARRLDRCLNHGWAGLERWVGWGVIANNIAVIVAWLNRRHRSLAKALAQ